MEMVLNATYLCLLLNASHLLATDDKYPETPIPILTHSIDEFEAQVFRLKACLRRIDEKLRRGASHPQYDVARSQLVLALEEAIRIRERQYAHKNALKDLGR